MIELEKAKAIAEKLKGLLEFSCERIIIAGSIRRQKPEVHDIELLCIPRVVDGVDQLDREIGSLFVQAILGYRLNKLGRRAYGKWNKLLVHLESGIGIDVFSTTEDRWPVALFVRTGGKETNKLIASRALARGLMFRAYGRGFIRADGSEIICRSEADVFRAVGLHYLSPEERR